MECPTCASVLPAGFPGATVACACGERVTIEGHASRPHTPISVQPLSGGPYRGGSAAPADEPASFPCPYCGNSCPALARVCPHCDVRLENVRCGRCWSLQQPGSFTCGRCGNALDLEPLLDATSAPCPRCNTPLEAAAADAAIDDTRTHECPRCGGIFVPRDVLAELLTKAEIDGPFTEPKKREILALDQVRYVMCPLCHSSMNRMNFGRVSGVIVDICKAHGTWFDGGELTRVIAFAAGGGLQKTRAREAADKRDEERHRAQARVDVAVQHVHYEETERIHQWRRLLSDLFFW